MRDTAKPHRTQIHMLRGLALPMLVILSSCGGGGSGSSTPPPVTVAPTPTPAPAPTPTPAPTSPVIPAPNPAAPPVATSAAIAFSQQMSPGINLGNTLEAIAGTGAPRPATSSEEGAWGQPQVTQALMNGYKAAGFKSVRIPVAWSQYANANDNIADFWMDRVQQVVDYARNAGLYVIINVHWDGGWVIPTADKKDAVNARLARFWTQIATRFRGYDNHLLFAGTNEIGLPDYFGAAPAENCTIQNGFNQTFVDTVRATGGNNANRYLVVQAWNTDIDNSLLCNTVMPADTATQKLMMEVHYYGPFNFTINPDSNIWQWGMMATTAAATESWANEAYADAEFRKAKSAFFDKGVPVILGEYAAYNKPAFPGMNPYRLYWIQYITQSSFQHGLVPMYWDTGELLDRTTGAVKDTEAVARLMGALP